MRRLTSRKYPLSLEQASNIHPEMEDMLNQAVGKYIKKKEHQRMKLITSNCETSLRQENEELCISKQVLEKKIEELLDLQEQYKSREVAMTRSLEESGGKVTQLSDSVAFFKSIIPDKKKLLHQLKSPLTCWRINARIWRILFSLRTGKLSLLLIRSFLKRSIVM